MAHEIPDDLVGVERTGLTQGVSAGLRQQVQTFDWANTPLGPRSTWPTELELVVEQVLSSGFPKAVFWGPKLTTIYNDAFKPILGLKENCLGRPFSEIWSEVWDQLEPISSKAFAGEATYIEDYPLTISRNGHLEEAYFTFCYSPLRGTDGTVQGVLDTVVETTTAVKNRDLLALANGELAHRLKNTLGIVQAIAIQTLKDATDRKALTSFEQGLQALAHAHDVMHRQNWTSVDLQEVVEDSISPHDALGQVAVGGPALSIGSGTTMKLSMLLHELGTNALKYGALSVPRGQVRVSWSIKAGHFVFHWREKGGPTVSKPDRKGFGTKLISRALGPGSKVNRRYNAKGFELDLMVPLALIAI